MKDTIQIFPVGIVRKQDASSLIEVYERYQDALLGLGQYSHILVFTWFHENDGDEKRATLRVHPRGDRTNPLTGVFATRSPVRPNLIALFVCEILSIEKNIIHIDSVDALDLSPVIDIKPYISRIDSIPGARGPAWLKK